MSHPDDICIWACGSWCLRGELSSYHYMSDDYMVLEVDSEEWIAFDEDNPLKR